MIFRRKTYKVHSSIVNEFNRHFNETLLPTQMKYGARLIGRWMTKGNDDRIEIFAIWEYDSYEDYEQIEAKVRSDKEHVKRVQSWFDKMGREKVKSSLKDNSKEDFLETTVWNNENICSKN
ncbi:NIPSNAP family protein [Bacillus sp. DX4.1]|uniref:NIPSNAP family protein n=1 Tax=Bacillus sp. DX4.1 TaxID=3055867 RepID=UPI0025A18168|nr:NIPSNAP family protein [Bacillus sp. DX4.1]MDM5189002.1 NIPSNAP family protein [Bacillus sp. DX4.1]